MARITSPNGGESLTAGSFHTITWDTFDTQEPVVQILTPESRTYINPSELPFTMFFEASDGDGSGGGVLYERVLLDDCVMYDGNLYGDGDGLLSDEVLEFSTAELCRLADRCGWTTLEQPVLRIEASDCGGNVGFDERGLLGRVQLIPDNCN